MKKIIKKIAQFNKVSMYWHVEAFLLVPFCIWFIWRVETIISILRQLN